MLGRQEPGGRQSPGFFWYQSRQTYQIRHDRAARSRHTDLILLRTIGGALARQLVSR